MRSLIGMPLQGGDLLTFVSQLDPPQQSKARAVIQSLERGLFDTKALRRSNLPDTIPTGIDSTLELLGQSANS